MSDIGDGVEPPLSPVEILLASALEATEPLPADLLDIARGLADWVDPDASIAEVVDQELAHRAMVVHRKYSWPEGVQIILQLIEQTNSVAITGGIEAKEPVSGIRLERSDGDREEIAVEVGTFELMVRYGPWYRLVVDTGTALLVTRWFQLRRGNS